jgi:DNA-binding MarR family transcriptional regulator
MAWANPFCLRAEASEVKPQSRPVIERPFLESEQQAACNMAWSLAARTVLGLFRIYEKELQQKHGISLLWFEIMSELHRVPDQRMRMQGLADAVVLSQSGLTRVVDGMESAKLVRRERDQADRRSYYVCLTEEGSSLLEAARPYVRGRIYEHFGRHLRDEDVVQLVSVFQSIPLAREIARKRGLNLSGAAEFPEDRPGAERGCGIPGDGGQSAAPTRRGPSAGFGRSTRKRWSPD